MILELSYLMLLELYILSVGLLPPSPPVLSQIFKKYIFSFHYPAGLQVKIIEFLFEEFLTLKVRPFIVHGMDRSLTAAA